jgi:two-component system phosphate regulon sensor histidine kinase PhoR
MTTSKPSKGLVISLSFKQNKNYTPRQVALATSFWITVGYGILLSISIFSLMPLWEKNYTWLVVFILLGFFVSYFILLYVLQNYIYRRVKLIYKTIHQKKLLSQTKKDSIDLDTNILEEVEKQVEDWANNKEQEVAKYKIGAEYRRRFVGDISHELKTPIFIIQSYLDTLLDGAWKDEQLCPKFLQKVSKSAERLQTIVQDLEAIAKLESGEMLLDMRSFDIGKLTEEIFEELEMQAKQSNIQLSFKEGAAFPYRVFADEDKIRQVMVNLVSNSIKYGNAGGKTKVSFYDMDRHVLIEVADNGIGIPAEHLPHVFNRFYRVDKSRTREQGGSGLGLSIVKHIVEVHKQTINVRSTVGHGSTFGFTLEKAR